MRSQKAASEDKKVVQKAEATKPKQDQQQPLEEGRVVQQHWDVPVMSAKAMKIGVEGVCLCAASEFQIMYDVLKGTAAKTAILVPLSSHIGEIEHQMIIIWVKLKEKMIQVTRKLIQAGSSPVQYIPLASRGASIRTKQMTFIVLEIVKVTFDLEKDWEDAVAKAAATFETY